MNDDFFSWKNYLQQETDEGRELILETKGVKNLGVLNWRKQADLFDGAPMDVLLCYFKDLHWKAQVKVWDYFLPADAEKWVKAYLKPEAAVKLGLRKKKKKQPLLA